MGGFTRKQVPLQKKCLTLIDLEILMDDCKSREEANRGLWNVVLWENVINIVNG